MQRETLQQIRALPMLDPSDRSAAADAETADIRFDRGRRVSCTRTGARRLTVMESRARAELLRAATA